MMSSMGTRGGTLSRSSEIVEYCIVDFPPPPLRPYGSL